MIRKLLLVQGFVDEKEKGMMEIEVEIGWYGVCIHVGGYLGRCGAKPSWELRSKEMQARILKYPCTKYQLFVFKKEINKKL